MPDLLHEYWESDTGGEFGPVREHSDQLRPTVTPGARRVFSLRAASWHQAMRLYHDRLGYGEYCASDDVSDYFYTEGDAAEQDAYLRIRNVG